MNRLENFIKYVRQQVQVRAERREARKLDEAAENARQEARMQQAHDLYKRLVQSRDVKQISDIEREEFAGRRAEYKRLLTGYK